MSYFLKRVRDGEISAYLLEEAKAESTPNQFSMAVYKGVINTIERYESWERFERDRFEDELRQLRKHKEDMEAGLGIEIDGIDIPPLTESERARLR